MSRALKLLLLIPGVLIGALVILVLMFDPNWLRSWLQTRATGSAGRDITIEGDISWQPSWRPLITIEGLTVGNPTWLKEPYLARIERLVLRIDLWQLLQGQVVLPEVTLAKPVLHLVRNQKGEANWQSPGNVEADVATEAVVPDDRTEIPVIGRLQISDGVFDYVDQSRGAKLAGNVNTVLGEGSEGDQTKVSGNGELAGKPYELALSAGTLSTLQDASKPYPVNLDLTFGETKLQIDGTLTAPLQLKGLDLTMRITGPDLAEVFPLIGLPTPKTPDYELAGRLYHEEQLWRFSDFSGRLGGSDLSGTMTVDGGQEPLAFSGDLRSQALRLQDLEGLIGGDPNAPDNDDPDLLIPNQPINLPRLQAANGEVKLTAERIQATDLPIDDLTLAATLKDGVLRLTPARFGIAQGNIDLQIALDGTQDPPKIEAQGSVRDLRLKDALQGSRFAQETGGMVNGRVRLAGAGRSLHEMLGAADGQIYLVMTKGTVSGLLIELVGLDAAESLGLYLGQDTPVRIRCMVSDLAVEDGLATSKMFVLDTDDTLVEGGGKINFAKEALDLTIAPHPKDISLLSLRSNILVQGTFKSPAVSLDAKSILAYLPPIDLGLAKDAQCDRMIERARDDQDQPER